MRTLIGLTRNPALLAIIGALCLQGPVSGKNGNAVQFLLATADGVGFLTLALIELRLRWGRD